MLHGSSVIRSVQSQIYAIAIVCPGIPHLRRVLDRNSLSLSALISSVTNYFLSQYPIDVYLVNLSPPHELNGKQAADLSNRLIA